jgi:PEP-CTERM motif
MRLCCLYVSAVTLALSFSANSAFATPIGLNGPLATYSPPFGSAHRDAVETFLDGYYPTTGISFLGRLSSAGVADFTDSPLLGSGATFVGTNLTTTDGTWTLTQDASLGSVWDVLALEINGGSNGAVYDINPAGLVSSACVLVVTTYTCTGNWDTNDLSAGASENSPTLSHLDLYGRLTEVSETSQVPEPSSLALLAGGLGALLLRRRRRAAIRG